MKVLVVAQGADFAVSDVYDGLVAGLRACGAVVGEFRMSDRLTFYSAAHIQREDGEFVKALSREDAIRMACLGIEQACYRFWPDVIVIVTGTFIPPELWGVLARRPHHVVLWGTESPYEDDRTLVPSEFADTVIVNDPRNMGAFRAVNPRTWYFPHSFDPARHHPGLPAEDMVCDFGFVGTGFPSRIEFLEAVDWTGIDVKLGGSWFLLDKGSPLMPFLIHPQDHCLDNIHAARLYRSAKVTANLYRKETSEGGDHDGWAMGPREVELAACGAFFMREPRGEGDALFPMLPTFTTPQEFESQLRWWLAHDDDRVTAARKAHEAIADRTFANTAAALLSLVEAAPPKVMR